MPFDPTPVDPRQQILNRAAEFVERGWCRRSMFCFTGGSLTATLRDVTEVCAMGAITLAVAESQGLMDHKVCDVAGNPTVTRQVSDIAGSATVSMWNDFSAKDAGEVAAMLRSGTLPTYIGIGPHLRTTNDTSDTIVLVSC